MIQSTVIDLFIHQDQIIYKTGDKLFEQYFTLVHCLHQYCPVERHSNLV